VTVSKKERKCPKCGSEDVADCAIVLTAYRTNGEKQVEETKYKQCRKCGHEWETSNLSADQTIGG